MYFPDDIWHIILIYMGITNMGNDWPNVSTITIIHLKNFYKKLNKRRKCITRASILNEIFFHSLTRTKKDLYNIIKTCDISTVKIGDIVNFGYDCKGVVTSIKKKYIVVNRFNEIPSKKYPKERCRFGATLMKDPLGFPINYRLKQWINKSEPGFDEIWKYFWLNKKYPLRATKYLFNITQKKISENSL